MNISLNWLTDYVDVSIPAGELGELFTRIGLNCEGITETASDIVFDLEVTSNRPDLLGHLGVARELAAATGAAFRLPKIKSPPTGGKVDELTAVDVQAADLCPRYTARVIRDVKVGPSPQWLVDRVEAVGLRSINNVVDVTNFVLMEYSQPLHSFDYDKLAGHRIVVRQARKAETLISIDETTCELDESMLVIADAERPVAVAGVMGALNTEVTSATTNVLIESARFDPLNTRRASRKLALMSESNYRFERGVDPVAVETASLRACALICELAGGTLAEGVIDVWADPYEAPCVSLRTGRTNMLMGIDVPPERQKEILDRLGLSPKSDAGRVVCTIPPHRADLTREADLIEEVARLVGYDKIPIRGEITHRVTAMGRTERIRRGVLTTLAAAGYSEAITFSFIDPEEAGLFGVDNPVLVDSTVRKTNNALRPTLLPSLLRACKTNQDLGSAELSLFELAAVFPPADDSPLPDEFVELAMVTTEGLRDVRGAVEAVVERIAPGVEVAVNPAGNDIASSILLDGEGCGAIGIIPPNVRKYYGLEKSIAAAVLRFDALAERANLTRTARALPKFPPSRRDLSLIVDESVTWGRLIEAIRGVDQPLCVRRQYVTTYRGKPIPPGRKSVTVNLEYRCDSGTLTGEQVEEQVSQVFSAMKEKFNAELRT